MPACVGCGRVGRVLREAQDWLDAEGAAEGAADGVAAPAAVGSPTVMLCTVIFSFGLTFSPASFATVAIFPMVETVSMPPVTVPTIGHCGSPLGVKSLKKMRNWLPFVPGGSPISATVPFGY